MQLDGVGSTDVKHVFSEEIPEPAPILDHLLASWESHYGYPASQEMISALQKLLISRTLLGESREEIMEKGVELVLQGWGVLGEQHGGNDDAGEEGDAVKLFGRRGLALAPLHIPEPIAPVDDTTREFLQDLTAASSEGKSLWEDFQEALSSPTTPTGVQDTSADQQIDSSILLTTQDESSESGTSSTLPFSSEDEATTGPSSQGPSPPGVSPIQNDESPGGEQTKGHPHSTG